MPDIIPNSMASNESHKADSTTINVQSPEPSTQQTSVEEALVSAPQNRVSHPSGAYHSQTSLKHKSHKSKKRNRPSSYRVSLWSRVKSPILQCRRCGERYRALWTKDTRCPKCGRHPMKVQQWEKVLYTLVFPAALIGAMVHFGRSPRNAAVIFGMGFIGLLAEIAVYFFVN